jgi:predicted phage terminase large subunit-like protein
MKSIGRLTQGKMFRRLDELERRAELQATGFEDDSPTKREARVERALVDPLYFCRTYLPHWFRSEPAEFHGRWLELLADYAVITDDLPKGVANICPRGFAKTTVANFGISSWLAVTGKVPFWTTCFDILAKGNEIVEAVADELAENRKLRGDFGDLLKEVDKGDGRWKLVTTHGTCLQGLGMNASFRGLKFRQHRPHLFICDDPEHDQGVRNPKTREHVRTLVAGAVRFALEPGGTIWVNQNIIHPDCFNGHVAADVERAREAEELGLELNEVGFSRWKVFEYPADEDGRSNWPARFSYEGLMELRAADPDQYDMEMRGLRIETDLKVFRRSTFRFFEEADREGRPEWRIVALDPSKGKTDRSDYSSIICLGIDAETNDAFVREADLQRRPTDQIVRDFVHACLRWRPALAVVEDVAYQELLKDQIEAELRRAGIDIPIVGFSSSTPKELRIESLGAPVRTGRIQFKREQVLLLEQLEQFPHAAHDDGPDGLHMAWSKSPVGRFGGRWVDWSKARTGGSRTGWFSRGEQRHAFGRAAGGGF